MVDEPHHGLPRTAPGAGAIGVGAPGLMYFLKENGVQIPPQLVMAVGVVSALLLLIAAIQVVQWCYVEQIKSPNSALRKWGGLVRRKLELIHIIILALVVALGAAVWQAYRGPSLISPAPVAAAPSAEDIAKATAPIRAERDKAVADLATVIKERDVLRRQSAALPSHDAEWKRIRQAANRDITDYLSGPFQTFTDAAQAAIPKSDAESVADFLRKAEDLKRLLVSAIREQSRMLSKYNGIDDVFDMTDWNFLAKVVDPALDECIVTLRLLRQDDHAIRLSGQPSIYKFHIAVEKIPSWVNDTQRSVGNLRARLDKQ